MQIIQQAKRNLITGYLHFFVLSLIMLLLTPFYIDRLGVQTYGYWAVLNSIIGYLSILDLGMGLASTKFTAEAIAKGDKIHKSHLISQVFFLYLVISAILLAASFFLARYLPLFFKVPENIWGSAAVASFLMILSLISNLLSKFFVGISFGHQKQEAPNIIAVVSAILQGGLSYWFLDVGFGIIGLASAVIIASVLAFVLRVLYCSRKFGPLGISFNACKKSSWGPLLKFGGGIFITAVGGQIILNTDNLLIGKILDLKLVAAYSILYMLIMSAGTFFQKISDVFFPVLTDSYTRGDNKNLKFYFFESTFLSLVGFTSFAVGMACFGENIISFWVGSERFVGHQTLWAIIAFFWLQTYIHGHANLLISVGRLRPIVRFNISEAFFNIALSFLLIHKFAVLGVAVGSLLAMLSTNYAFLPKYSSDILQVSRFDIDRKLTFSVLLPTVPILVVGFVIKHAAELSGFAQTIGVFAATAILYLLAILVVLGSERRKWYYHKLYELFLNRNSSDRNGLAQKDIDYSGDI